MLKTKQLAEIAISIALAVVFKMAFSFLLGFLKLPQGGDLISLEMLPIFFIAIRYGAKEGILAGCVYGLISILFDTLYHPLSILLDYLFAFGVLGIAGFFPKKISGIICGCTVATFMRFIFHLLSGVFLFASFAPEGQNPWIYSIIYNVSHLVPSLVISLIILVLLYASAPKLFAKQS